MGNSEENMSTLNDKLKVYKKEESLKDEIKYYVYDCPINIKDIQPQIKYSSNRPSSAKNRSSQPLPETEIIFNISNIKLHNCYSRDKTTKKSLFIMEIKLGTKSFELFYSYGNEPHLKDRIFDEKIKCTYLTELTNYFFTINVHEVIGEFTEDIIKDLENNQNSIENYKLQSKHCSYFQMDFMSFIFRANLLDFALLGKSPISPSARISFQCDIEQFNSFIITVKELKPNQNIEKNEFIINSKKYNSKININNNNGYCCRLKTIPLSMNDLSNSDFYMQLVEKNFNGYRYYSLNELKAKIFKELTNNILNSFGYFLISKDDDYEKKKINYNSLFPKYITKNSEKYSLTIENLPIIVQIRNLIFTEKGHKSRSSMFYIVNNDIYVVRNLQGKCVLYKEMHPKLLDSLEKLKKID